jgi:hypothetical protein
LIDDQPLASHPEEFLASLSELGETPAEFREHRCKRLIDDEPLASAPEELLG